MLGKERHKKISDVLIIAIAFLLPLANYVPICISLLLLNWLLEGNLKEKFTVLLQNKIALLFIAVYLVHFISMLYTSNKADGMFDLQVKLSLIIFPIVFGSKLIDDFSIVKKAMFGLTFGSIVSCVFLLFRAIYIYHTTGENNFYYQDFSILLHPSFFAMYLNTSIAFIGYNLIIKGEPNYFFSKAVSITTILFFTSIIFLLSSKMGIITMLLTYLSIGISYLIKSKKYFFGILITIAFALLFIITLKLLPQIGQRFINLSNAVNAEKVDTKDAESNAVRLLIWKAATHLIAHNFVSGVGAGDTKDALLQEYEKRGMTGAIEHSLNAHNQYFQLFLAIGIIGFIFFIASLVFPFLIQLKNKNWFYCYFILLLGINFLVESMFETQAGTMFYGFFNSLLFFSSTSINTKNSKFKLNK
jgi:O-antigen ligase